MLRCQSLLCSTCYASQRFPRCYQDTFFALCSALSARTFCMTAFQLCDDLGHCYVTVYLISWFIACTRSHLVTVQPLSSSVLFSHILSSPFHTPFVDGLMRVSHHDGYRISSIISYTCSSPSPSSYLFLFPSSFSFSLFIRSPVIYVYL